MLWSSLKLVFYVAIFVATFVAIFFVGTWIVQIVWTWVVLDVFAGAVKNGNLPASLEFWQAFKLSVLLSVLGIASRSSLSSNK